MENPFSVSLLNDFVFCPASIYFHMVDAATDKIFYESKEQQDGSALHEKTDSGQYSDRKNVLQGIVADIYNKSIKSFDEQDSVYIFKMSASCQILKYGYARHDDEDLLIVS